MVARKLPRLAVPLVLLWILLANAGCGAGGPSAAAGSAPAATSTIPAVAAATAIPARATPTAPIPAATTSASASPTATSAAPPTSTKPPTQPPLPPVPTAVPPRATPAATATAESTTSVGVHREFVAEIASGQLTGLQPTPDGKSVSLASQAQGRYVAQGDALSQPYQPGFRFNNLVLSWTAGAPAGTSLAFYARVQAGGQWSGWYQMATWRDGRGASLGGQSDAWGKVATDTLVLNRLADAWQYRVVLATTDATATPALRSVSVAIADTTRPPTGPAVALAAGWARELNVPVESQAIQDPAVAWEICSPTSLTMTLRYLGTQVTLRQVYQGVRDGTNGIYGNWPLNTAYAATLGYDAYVARLYALAQIKNEIAAGRPVPISIKYQSGELPGAALNSTSGHFVVVRGFTAAGEVILNDPAAPGLSAVRRVVKAADLERVWLRSGGIAYMVAPAGQ